MKKRIAIDIDDVLAEHTDFVRRYVNEKLGVALTYEDYRIKLNEYDYYFKTIWESHSIDHSGLMEEIHDKYVRDQSFVTLIEGAKEAVDKLKAGYDLYAVSSRPINQLEATLDWIQREFEGIFQDVTCLGNHHNHDKIYSKGGYCEKIGAKWLIDDNLRHCLSAVNHGAHAILFGNYGWQLESEVPESVVWLESWEEVTGYLLREANR